MRVTRQYINRLIHEERVRLLRERTKPETLDIDPEEMTFSVVAEPTRPEEGEEDQTITGKIEKHKGRYLPKADPENLPFGYESSRSVSGQLSAQLRDAVNDMLGAVPDLPSSQRETKGRMLADALAAIASKYPDDPDVSAAINTILSVKMGFDVPYGAEEEVEETEVEQVNEMSRRILRRAIQRELKNLSK
jgi:hypothetical protein